MPNVSDYFKGTFLKAADLKGRQAKVTIKEVGEFEAQDGKVQPTISFIETDLVLGLNKTNAMTIAEVIGVTDMDLWPGHRIQIFPTQTDFGGKRVDCIRVRSDFHEAPGSAKQANGKAKAEQPKAKADTHTADDPYTDVWEDDGTTPF